MILYNSDRQGPREELFRAQGRVHERAQKEEAEEQEVRRGEDMSARA